MVYVAGEVVRPGVYPVGPEARTRDVLALAGGTRPDADLIAVNLAAHLRDGDEIVVPVRGAALSSATARSSRGRGRGYGGNPRRAGESRGVSSADSADSAYRSGGKHRASGRGRRGRGARSGGEGPPPVAEVDINTADAETLATIPGIGDGLAQRIVLFREQNGAFASVDELLDVAGITEHRLDAMIPYVVAR
jgi:competence protein ComEA